MYQRILVAIDESTTSELALKEAALLAKEQDATLRLAHVIDDTVAYTSYTTLLPPREPLDPLDPLERQATISLQAAAEAGLRRFGENVLARAAAAARALGANAETTLLSVVEAGGRVYDSIEQEAARWPADLVVIGTHGRRGFRRLFLGSVAEGFIRITTKPVLLVRGGE
jgi:nucleotide-binding universal stress UspA family protein